MSGSKITPWEKIILHADLDAFYAAVEQLDRPELRGRPLIIGGMSQRGVVTTASYEARPYGVGSAMPMAEALRRCPHAIVVRPRMDRYVTLSKQVMSIFGRFSPIVEPLSVDEAFLDMSGTERLFGAPREMANALRAAVLKETGLVVSVGVASTKYVAKVASDIDKPDGLCVVPPEDVISFLWPLDIRRLWGIGPRTETRLRRVGLNTIGEVAQRPRADLERRLGSLGRHIHDLANGRDPRRVISGRSAHSIGSERTLEHDIRGKGAIWPHLLRAADRIAQRMRKKGFYAGGVRVKLKTNRFVTRTHQSTLACPTQSADVLLARAKLLLESFDLSEPLRLIGLTAYDLKKEAPRQLGLFEEKEKAERNALDQTLDQVAERFGSNLIRRASVLDLKKGPRHPSDVD